MLDKIESLKDTVQVAVDSGSQRLERIHNLVVDYVKQHAADIKGEEVLDRRSIYDLVRAINKEVGEAATDVFEMVENAQRARANRERDQA